VVEIDDEFTSALHNAVGKRVNRTLRSMNLLRDPSSRRGGLGRC
jgi:hypothetical protein